MTLIDLITRVDAICKKYEKYDVDKQKELNVAGDDAFARLYSVIEADLDAAVQVTLPLPFSLLFNHSSLKYQLLVGIFLEIGGGPYGEKSSDGSCDERGDSKNKSSIA